MSRQDENISYDGFMLRDPPHPLQVHDMRGHKKVSSQIMHIGRAIAIDQTNPEITMLVDFEKEIHWYRTSFTSFGSQSHTDWFGFMSSMADPIDQARRSGRDKIVEMELRDYPLVRVPNTTEKENLFYNLPRDWLDITTPEKLDLACDMVDMASDNARYREIWQKLSILPRSSCHEIWNKKISHDAFVEGMKAFIRRIHVDMDDPSGAEIIIEYFLSLFGEE